MAGKVTPDIVPESKLEDKTLSMESASMKSTAMLMLLLFCCIFTPFTYIPSTLHDIAVQSPGVQVTPIQLSEQGSPVSQLVLAVHDAPPVAVYSAATLATSMLSERECKQSCQPTVGRHSGSKRGRSEPRERKERRRVVL